MLTHPSEPLFKGFSAVFQQLAAKNPTRVGFPAPFVGPSYQSFAPERLVRSLPPLFLFLLLAAPACASLDMGRAEKVLVEKGARRLVLLAGGKAIRIYPVALGRNPVGHKVRRGDGRTPEGTYVIDFRKEDSRFHRALRISYPSPADRARASALGVSPGGDIMIHGLPAGYGDVGGFHRATDWTKGCIAVTNEEIEEIWSLVPDGTPVEIRP